MKQNKAVAFGIMMACVIALASTVVVVSDDADAVAPVVSDCTFDGVDTLTFEFESQPYMNRASVKLILDGQTPINKNNQTVTDKVVEISHEALVSYTGIVSYSILEFGDSENAATGAIGLGTVTFDGNGAEGSKAPVRAGGEYTLPSDEGFTAPANTVFDGWSLDGTTPIDGPITIVGDVTLKAVWKEGVAPQVQYDVTFDLTDGQVRVDGADPQDSVTTYKVTEGTMVSVDGTVLTVGTIGYEPVADGYRFIQWLANGEEFDTFAIGSDTIFTAVFSEEFIVTVITPSVGGDATTEKDVYISDEKVILTLVTDEGYSFIGWVTNGPGISPTMVEGEYTFTMGVSEVTIEPLFKKLYQISISADPEEAGTPYAQANESTVTKAVSGTTIALMSGTNNGYAFVEWVVEAPMGLTVNGNGFTMPEGDVTITASYELLDDGVRSIEVTSSEGGSAGAYLAGQPDVPINKADEGQTVVLKAEAEEGYVFSKWEITGTNPGINVNEAETSFTVGSEDVNVKALFVKKTYQVTVQSDDNGTIVTEIPGGTITVEHGEQILVDDNELTIDGNLFTANAVSTYVFDMWVSGDGDPLPQTVTGPMTITAVFEPAPVAPTVWDVVIDVSGNGTVVLGHDIISDIGHYEINNGSVMTLQLVRQTPEILYVYSVEVNGASVDAEQIVNDHYRITVTGDLNIDVTFSINPAIDDDEEESPITPTPDTGSDKGGKDNTVAIVAIAAGAVVAALVAVFALRKD